MTLAEREDAVDRACLAEAEEPLPRPWREVWQDNWSQAAQEAGLSSNQDRCYRAWLRLADVDRVADELFGPVPPLSSLSFRSAKLRARKRAQQRRSVAAAIIQAERRLADHFADEARNADYEQRKQIVRCVRNRPADASTLPGFPEPFACEADRLPNASVVSASQLRPSTLPERIELFARGLAQEYELAPAN